MPPRTARYATGFLRALQLTAWILLLSWPATAAAASCRPVIHQAARFTVCSVDLKTEDLRLFWRSGTGQPYRSTRALEGELATRGLRLAFAMNAGMFEADGAPVGLYVEDGTRFRPANTATGPGNFHLKPNGVFFWNGGRAGIFETGRFLKEKPAADFATQSGPMLVIDGKLHPAFLADSTSFKVRNGVGIASDGEVVFAISETAVTFHSFATLFRDVLGCRNALFLDGSVSVLFTPERGHPAFASAIGPIVGVVSRN
mgnify:CR=1 FL=1